MQEIIIVLLLVLVILLYFRRMSFFENDDVQVVIAVYNEDTNYLKEEPLSSLDVICYHKGKNDIPQCSGSKCKVKKLPNVGREAHTYLHHIIENYSNLAPVTVFIPGSWTHEIKKDNTLTTIAEARDQKKTIIHSFPVPEDDSLLKFQIEEYTSSNEKNRKHNETSSMQLCPQRPFGEWFKHNFPDTPLTQYSYHGIFAVSREDIIKHPIEFYKNLIKYVDSHSNEEAAHYFERAWYSIFAQN